MEDNCRLLFNCRIGISAKELLLQRDDERINVPCFGMGKRRNRLIATLYDEAHKDCVLCEANV